MTTRQRGVTLLELMMALAILGVMMVLAWSSTRSTAEAKKQVERNQERNHEIRVAMLRMVKDLESAYLSANERRHPDAERRRTVFLGKDSAEAMIRFSSLAHVVLWADADESEQTMITYYTESDPEDSSKTNLLRRATRRLTDEGWRETPAEVDLLLRDVEEIEFEFYDWRAKEWKDRWDSTSAAQSDRLPSRVRITVEVPTRGGDTREFMTQARIMMQEQLQSFAQ